MAKMTWEVRHETQSPRFPVARAGGDAEFRRIEARRHRARLQNTGLASRQGIYVLAARRIEEGSGGGVFLSRRLYWWLQSTGAHVCGESRQVRCRRRLGH